MQGLQSAARHRTCSGTRPCGPRHAGARPRAGRAGAPAPAAVSATAVSRLPSTHLESSKKALELLKAQSINRGWPPGG
jgi:hypothetical protein